MIPTEKQWIQKTGNFESSLLVVSSLTLEENQGYKKPH